jgi:hypothetical protein
LYYERLADAGLIAGTLRQGGEQPADE